MRLRHVHIPDPSLDLSRFPDFMIVGPQRTGTTWLYENLRTHPQVLFAEPKETFFFSSLGPGGNGRFGSNDLGRYLSMFPDPPGPRVIGDPPIVRGEATASYAHLAPEIIAEIAQLNPRLRVLLMIRNPVERTWSHAKKDLAQRGGRSIADVGDGELEAFFVRPGQRIRANYPTLYARWCDAFGEDRVLWRAFDEIRTRPRRLLLDVMSFLTVDDDSRHLTDRVTERINSSDPVEIPTRHRRRLERLFAGELRRISDTFGLRWPIE